MTEINEINSNTEAIDYWFNNYGEPDYFSNRQDVTDVETQFHEFHTEFESLQREISRYDVNHHKMNKVISLYFLIRAGEAYLQKLNDVVYNNVYEEELEKLDLIQENYNDPRYWEE